MVNIKVSKIDKIIKFIQGHFMDTSHTNLVKINLII